MQKLSILIALLISVHFSFAQSTIDDVYAIFQNKCASCHSGVSPAGNLDLQGTGGNPQQDVYNRIYEGQVANSHAQSKGYNQIYPGRPDRSFIFRKIHDGLEPTIVLDNAEHQNGTPHGAQGLTDAEKELIRQWTLFAAPDNGQVVDPQLLVDYYNGQGLPSFPNGAPAGPPAGQGFQIKMGPFFLEPSTGLNVEYFQKWELSLGNDREVNRIESLLGTSSHHFIVYDYNDYQSSLSTPHGLRNNANHSDVRLISAIQATTDLVLPQGSAFTFANDAVLDLNSHYINYHNLPYKAEVYMNVYTQPYGTAAQEMKAFLFANQILCVPNDGQPYTGYMPLQFNYGDVYLWGLMGHTHQLGTGYKVWESDLWQKQDLIYDGSCPNGVPGCANPYFDYQHIPIRYFDPFYPVDFSSTSGLIHEGYYLNNGPTTVCWGNTSADEMQVLIAFYLDDTTGVTMNPGGTTSIDELDLQQPEITVAPNPMDDYTTFSFDATVLPIQLSLYDLHGRLINDQEITSSQFDLQRGNLPKGIYFYQAIDHNKNMYSGKLVMR